MSSLDQIEEELKQISLSSPCEVSKLANGLNDLSLRGIATLLSSGQIKRVAVLCGAGISVSAGIPDFRTPGTGLYSQLASYGLPRPESVFELGYFRQNPKPFCRLAKEMFVGQVKPTPTHYFLRLLHDKNLLGNIITQNIDSLETDAGIPSKKVYQIHGGLNVVKCINCSNQITVEEWKAKILNDEIPRCPAPECDGVYKPDIIFFGERLNTVKLLRHDLEYLPKADLFLCMGTSLAVMPAGHLVRSTNQTCPRVLINLEKVGVDSNDEEDGSIDESSHDDDEDEALNIAFANGDTEQDTRDLSDLSDDEEWSRRAMRSRKYIRRKYSSGFRFDSKTNKRDVFLCGSCDDVVFELVHAAGWSDDYIKLLRDADHATAIERFEAYLKKVTEAVTL